MGLTSIVISNNGSAHQRLYVILSSSAPISSMHHEVNAEDINHLFHHNALGRNLIKSLLISLCFTLLLNGRNLDLETTGGLKDLNV